MDGLLIDPKLFAQVANGLSNGPGMAPAGFVSNTRATVSFEMGETVDEWATVRARRGADKQAVVKRQAVFITISQIIDGVPDPNRVRRMVTPQDIAKYPREWAAFVLQHPDVHPETGRIKSQPKPKFRLHDTLIEGKPAQRIERVA